MKSGEWRVARGRAGVEVGGWHPVRESLDRWVAGRVGGEVAVVHLVRLRARARVGVGVGVRVRVRVGARVEARVRARVSTWFL